MKLFDVRVYKWEPKRKVSILQRTVLWNSPYSLCKFKATTTFTEHGEYVKIVPN